MSRDKLAGVVCAILLLVGWASKPLAMSRDEALVRAQTYCFHPWTSAAKNLTASCLGSYESIYVPGDYLGLPYDWGGYVTLFQFDDGIKSGKGAGSYPEHGVLSCTVGLDCSGYVSKIWGVGHFGTATIHEVSHEIAFGAVLPGDAFNVPGYHVVLFAGELSDGWPVFYEAIGYNTMYNTFAGWANVSGFTPIRLDGISGSAGPTPQGTAGNPLPVKSFPHVHNGNTANSKSDMFDYYGADTGKKESGPEVIYAVEVKSPGKLTVSVQDGAGVDIDVHLCSALETYHCIARHDSLIEADITNCGTWYVVADTWCNASGVEFPGAYTLTIEFAAKGGGCSANSPFDFVGGIGEPCGYPGEPDLPFCNPNLGALTCLYSNADDFSFCTYPCAADSDCQTEFPGGCCADVAGAGDAADYFCMVDDFCAVAPPPVDEGPDEPGEDLVEQPIADVQSWFDSTVPTADLVGVDAPLLPGDGAAISPDYLEQGPDGHIPAGDAGEEELTGEGTPGADALVGADGGVVPPVSGSSDGSCSAAPLEKQGLAGLLMLLGAVLLIGLGRRRLMGLGSALLLLLLLVGCSGEPSPGAELSADATPDGVIADGGRVDGQSTDANPDAGGVDAPKGDTGSSADGDVQAIEEMGCVPSCAGKECGDDGCGGSCGECPAPSSTCNPAGLCAPVECESSKDCPGDLICYKEAGFCVECAVSADCGENQKCTSNYLCVDVVACISDKDCKAVDGVCDKEAGECVDCLTALDCPAEWLCVGKVCFEPACQANEVRCNGQAVEICNETLTGFDQVKNCPENQFCVAGKCLDHVCEPDAMFCDGEVATLCNADGSGPAETVDCAAVDLFCSGGECTACEPQCQGKECGDDGCGGDCGLCLSGTPCVQDGDKHVCGTPCDLAALQGRSVGCEFWAVDLDNVEGGQYEPVELFVAVPPGNGAAKLLVERFEAGAPIALTAADLKVASLDVAEGTVATFVLPSGLDVDGTAIASKAIRVKSSVPVTVHQFNPANGGNVFTSDASLLLPAHLSGKEYVALSWPQRTSGYTLRGNVAIVATGSGDTFVQLWVTSAVKAGEGVDALAGGNEEPYELALKQGEVLSLETDGDQGADLTGSRVQASKAVAVFGGHECANIPLGTNYCDHIEQQLLPVGKLDKLYAGDAFAPRNADQKDVWRVVAAKDDTMVAVVPQVAGPYTLNAGQWVEFYAGESFVLEASKPVAVGHYMQGSNYSGFEPYPSCSGSTGIGDPAFTIAIPINSFNHSHRVLIPADYDLDYLNIIAQSGSGDDVTLDGLAVGTPFVPMGSSGYAVAQVPIDDGVHEVASAGTPIGVTAYGYACDVSYAYPGGL